MLCERPTAYPISSQHGANRGRHCLHQTEAHVLRACPCPPGPPPQPCGPQPRPGLSGLQTSLLEQWVLRHNLQPRAPPLPPLCAAFLAKPAPPCLSFPFYKMEGVQGRTAPCPLSCGRGSPLCEPWDPGAGLCLMRVVLNLPCVLGPGLTVSVPTLFYHSPEGRSIVRVCVWRGTWRKIALGPAEGLSEEAMVQRRASSPLCSQGHRVDLGGRSVQLCMCPRVQVSRRVSAQALCVSTHVSESLSTLALLPEGYVCGGWHSRCAFPSV